MAPQHPENLPGIDPNTDRSISISTQHDVLEQGTLDSSGFKRRSKSRCICGESVDFGKRGRHDCCNDSIGRLIILAPPPVVSSIGHSNSIHSLPKHLCINKSTTVLKSHIHSIPSAKAYTQQQQHHHHHHNAAPYLRLARGSHRHHHGRLGRLFCRCFCY